MRLGGDSLGGGDMAIQGSGAEEPVSPRSPPRQEEHRNGLQELRVQLPETPPHPCTPRAGSAEVPAQP